MKSTSRISPRSSIKRLLAIGLIILGLCQLLMVSWPSVAADKQLVAGASAITAANSGTAILLEINGGIGPAVQDFIERGIKSAVKQQAHLVIIQMDTPGGLSKSMRGIIKAILASPIPIVSYVAPSGSRAASAGTYILYASHVAAMAPGTNLGAATPVSLVGSDKDSGDKDNKSAKSSKQQDKSRATKSAKELKAVNDAKAYIRGLAQLRKRNVKWAEDAVLKAESMSAEDALKHNVIDVMANNIPDLLHKIDGRLVLVQDKAVAIASTNLTVKQVLPDWKTKFLSVITDPSVAYVLIMVGFYGLFFEFANPGFVLPGIVGAISLLLALYALQLLPIDYAGLLLMLLGLAFIVAEAFVPSFGALGIGGVVAFLIGSILLIKTDVPGFSIPLKLIIGVTAATALFFLGVLQLAFRSRLRPVVSGNEAMVGQVGEVVVDGNDIWVHIAGERWSAQSKLPLKHGQNVEVTAVEGLSLRVKPTAKDATEKG